MTRVVLSRSASSALAALDFLLADAILDALSELERDPRIGHDLRGRLRGLRSYRVGAYRIIYEVRPQYRHGRRHSAAQPGIPDGPPAD